jgi:hypothetical protein
VVESTGECVSDKEVSKPEWIEQSFTTYRQCCTEARDKDACLRDRPCTEDDPCDDEEEVIPKPYYKDDTTGMCVSDSEKPKPKWIVKAYEHYEDCCKQVEDKTLCLEARPMEPGDTPYPTPAPREKFHHDETSGKCVSDKEKAPVSACVLYVPSTFRKYLYSSTYVPCGDNSLANHEHTKASTVAAY